jgi:hypothetical protein
MVLFGGFEQQDTVESVGGRFSALSDGRPFTEHSRRSWSDANCRRHRCRRQLKETKNDADRRLSLDALTIQMLTDFRQQRVAALAPAGLTVVAEAFVFSPDPAGLRPWHPDHFRPVTAPTMASAVVRVRSLSQVPAPRQVRLAQRLDAQAFNADVGGRVVG